MILQEMRSGANSVINLTTTTIDNRVLLGNFSIQLKIFMIITENHCP